jgi:hypothetical protein
VNGASEELRQYVYLKVAGSKDERFDPLEISRLTGTEPTESWRLGDAHPKVPGQFRTFDFWKVESPLGRHSDLNRQVNSLFANTDAWPALVMALSPHNPQLQFVVYTERDAVEFTIRPEVIERLLELRAEIATSTGFAISEFLAGVAKIVG